MASLQDKDLTCRQFKLNPLGCLRDAACPYAHRETGRISPPSTITCWSWKHGGCKYHEDGCLFAHYDTGIVQLSAFQGRHRPLHGRDRTIAKAAAVSGFDCSDIDRLMILVNAVRTADAGSAYPDYYKGESTRESDYLPARKRHRQLAYRDLDNPAVPAFGLTQEQIRCGVRHFGSSNDFLGYMGTHVVETSHHETINLYNKRTPGDNYWPPTTKKLKASSSMTRTNQVVIDLTQDNSSDKTLPDINESPAENHVHPSRRSKVSETNANRRATTSEQSRPAGRPVSSAQTRANTREHQTRVQTTKMLEKISNTLSAQTAQIVTARDQLRQRWDVDHQLQLQTVTDYLTVLNKAFGIMEETGKDAVHLIRDKLMS